jgi:hypothetical protein
MSDYEKWTIVLAIIGIVVKIIIEYIKNHKKK